jgi:hypothetical protein
MRLCPKAPVEDKSSCSPGIAQPAQLAREDRPHTSVFGSAVVVYSGADIATPVYSRKLAPRAEGTTIVGPQIWTCLRGPVGFRIS